MNKLQLSLGLVDPDTMEKLVKMFMMMGMLLPGSLLGGRREGGDDEGLEFH